MKEREAFRESWRRTRSSRKSRRVERSSDRKRDVLVALPRRGGNVPERRALIFGTDRYGAISRRMVYRFWIFHCNGFESNLLFRRVNWPGALNDDVTIVVVVIIIINEAEILEKFKSK